MNSRGIAIVWVGVFLFVLFGFAALAVDFAYMYFVKNAMQVAADAAALAGAGSIESSNTLTQPAAITNATAFAQKNGILLVDDGVLPEDDLEITVGFWDMNNSTFSPNTLPVNAVKVLTRRTASIFFGRVFGFASQTAAADAVAFRPPEPTTALSVCIRSCVVNTPTTFFFKEQPPETPPPDQTIAWSEFSCEKPTDLGPNSLIAQYIRGEKFPPNVCGYCITTNNSHGTVVLKILEEKFNERKDPSTGLWRVFVPVVTNAPSVDSCVNKDDPKCKNLKIGAQDCPPGDQTDERYWVTHYAVMNISGVHSPPAKPSIDVHSIGCVDCPATDLLGRGTRLVD